MLQYDNITGQSHPKHIQEMLLLARKGSIDLLLKSISTTNNMISTTNNMISSPNNNIDNSKSSSSSSNGSISNSNTSYNDTENKSSDDNNTLKNDNIVIEKTSKTLTVIDPKIDTKINTKINTKTKIKINTLIEPLKSIQPLNIEEYNILIKQLCDNGHIEMCSRILQVMYANNMKPSIGTYTTLISR